MSIDETPLTPRRMRVFISYSRSDIEHAQALLQALECENVQCALDKRDLPYGEKWRHELEIMIRSADTVVFLVSPRSIGSTWCRWELSQVTQQSKRLIPVVVAPVAIEALPPEVSDIHLLELAGGTVSPQFVRTLLEAIQRDRLWILQHSQLGERAVQWSIEGSADHLLRGKQLRDTERWLAHRPPSAPAPSKIQLDYILASRLAATKRERARRWAAACGAAGVLTLASAYLVATTDPNVWDRVPQPDNGTEFDRKPFLPIHDVAIYAPDPSLVLYLGRQAAWDSAVFSISPSTTPERFDARVNATLASTSLTTPVAQVKFSIRSREGRLRGSGTVDIWAMREAQQKVRYSRTFNFAAVRTVENGSPAKKAVNLSPKLLGEGSDAFDLGEYAEYLASNHLLAPDDRVEGAIIDLLAKRSYRVTYALDERLEDGETSPRSGAEYTVFGRPEAEQLTVGGGSVSGRANDPGLWKEIEASSDWVRVAVPLRSSAGGGLDAKPEDIVAQVPKIGEMASLVKVLQGLDWSGRREGVDARLISTFGRVGRADALLLSWWRTPQGSGRPVESEGEDWIVRLGESNSWRPMKLPAEDIVGIWAIDAAGDSALLLSAAQGFFRTRDGGNSWEPANYNETGFTDGRRVKVAVVNGAEGVFALIDRGTGSGDDENPLFRLKHRNWLERWRTGLARLLR